SSPGRCGSSGAPSSDTDPPRGVRARELARAGAGVHDVEGLPVRARVHGRFVLRRSAQARLRRRAGAARRPQRPHRHRHPVDVDRQGRRGVARVRRPVPVTGRVVLTAGDAASVAARVYFNRALRTPGADPSSVEVTAQAGKQPGEIGFRAMVAPNVPGEAYDVVVLPDDGTIQSAPAGETPAALAPPLKTRLEVTGQMRVDLALQDAAGLKTIGGRVVDAASRGMPGISVTAWGRRTPASPMELASSQATTAIDGSFVVYVPVSWDDTFDVLCAPGTLHAPPLRGRGVVARDGASALPALLLRYPSSPRAVRYELPVLGPDNAGGNRAADGAKVTLRPPLGATAGDEVTYETQATADSAGIAAVWLI